MRVLLVSTYELGRQPFGLASPAAWLRRAGCDVECIDAAKTRVSDESLSLADLIAVHLPMHTATRLATPLFVRARRLNPGARICAYGLYAPLNDRWLRSIGVDDVLGGEFEHELTAIASPETRPLNFGLGDGSRQLPRLQFLVPDRRGLPPLSRYATLTMPDGTVRTVGSTEASRGCRHLCRHCPVVPIYEGQFRIVQSDVVLADVARQVEAGAEHITFGDPDFFNGPTHAMRIVEALHEAHPRLTYDVTIKIEHLLRHGDLLPHLVRTGCAFVTSAVESIDDRVLAILDKGHTRADFFKAVDDCRRAGLALVPTFVAFHPWMDLDGYCELLSVLDELDLVDHVPPIQLAIRLLVPEGSRLLHVADMRPHLGAFDSATLSYQWTHPDSRVDLLHQQLSGIVGTRVNGNRRGVFDEIRAVACEAAGLPAPGPSTPTTGLRPPFLNEPWYCCAEPNPDDMRLV